MEEKRSFEFRQTVPDLSTPERIQDGRLTRAKTHISKGSLGIEKLEEKSSVKFRQTVPDLSTPERIQDGRLARAKTHISKGSFGVEKLEEKSSVKFRQTVPDLSTPERIQDGRHARAKTAISAPIFKLFFFIPSGEEVARRNPTSALAFFKRGRGYRQKPEVRHFRPEPQQVKCLFLCFRRCWN